MKISNFLFLKNKLIYIIIIFIFILPRCNTSYHLITNKKKSIKDYQTIINTTKNKSSIKTIRTYIQQEPLLNNYKKHQKNIDELWKLLININQNEINNINNNEIILKGWIDLSKIYQKYKYNNIILYKNFKNWKNRYPSNPGAKTPPKQLIEAMKIDYENNKKIAILLPMKGHNKIYSKIIIKGFLDAKKKFTKTYLNNKDFNLKKKENNNILNEIFYDIFEKTTITTSLYDENMIELESNLDIKNNNNQIIKIFDTTSKEIPELLNQIEKENFDIIVGPLLKKDVQNIVKIKSKIKILALNEIDKKLIQDHSNICYFSLSPENEAQNAAEHIKKQGKNTPLILVPENNLGKRIINSFVQEWKNKGGSIVFTQTFSSISSLKKLINKNIGIKLTGTPIILKKQSITQNNKIDSVYIFATNKELIFIKPMIEMTINSRLRPSFYASSRSNKANLSLDYILEMDGLQFSEIPLIVEQKNDIYKKILQNLNNNYSLFRLYAMGMDAWLLVNNYNKLKLDNNFYISGNSGVLNITDDLTIFRKLSWLEFKKGKLKKI